MKLEVKKLYRSNNGREVFIRSEVHPAHKLYNQGARFRADGNIFYDENGHYIRRISPMFDLVEEIKKEL